MLTYPTAETLEPITTDSMQGYGVSYNRRLRRILLLTDPLINLCRTLPRILYKVARRGASNDECMKYSDTIHSVPYCPDQKW